MLLLTMEHLYTDLRTHKPYVAMVRERMLLLCTTPSASVRYVHKYMHGEPLCRLERRECRSRAGEPVVRDRESKFTLLNRNHRRCRTLGRMLRLPSGVERKNMFSVRVVVVVVVRPNVGAGGENIYVHAQCACQCRLGM